MFGLCFPSESTILNLGDFSSVQKPFLVLDVPIVDLCCTLCNVDLCVEKNELPVCSFRYADLSSVDLFNAPKCCSITVGAKRPHQKP